MTDADHNLLPEDTPPGFRAGFVAVIGRPNVGKSTLMNAMLGSKVAIVSPRPQTTRRSQLGILTDERAQIVFVDTPGLNRPRKKLDRYMRQVVVETLGEVDALLWVVDVSRAPGPLEREVAALINEQDDDTPVVIAMNKADQLQPDKVLPNSQAFRDLVPRAGWMLTSATRGDNLATLHQMLIDVLDEGPYYYPPDQLTDSFLRDIAAELIREAALHLLREEIPHGVAVEIEQYDESDPALPRIHATLYVERDNHKGIVIGRGGQMLKAIGSRARHEIEAQLGVQVFLELRVKVRKDWRDDERAMRHLGYK